MSSLWSCEVILLFAVGLVIGDTSLHLPIEAQDRAFLEPFFEDLVTQETVGYVLLGEKPVALFSFIPRLSWSRPLTSLLSLKSYFSKENLIRKKGMEIWKKYQGKMSDRFLVIEENRRFPISWVFFIHKDLFCKIVDENRDEFEKVLERQVIGRELFEEARKHPFFLEVLGKHDGLLGILLGYGRKNALGYFENKMNHFGFFPRKEDADHLIRLPHFRANWSDPETLELRGKYLRCREKIKEKFLDHNVLDEVFKMICACPAEEVPKSTGPEKCGCSQHVEQNGCCPM
jgi:hypothetical protein